jgi:hypothetical protein
MSNVAEEVHSEPEVAEHGPWESPHASTPSPGIAHGIGQTIRQVASELQKKNVFRKHYDKQGQLDGTGAGTLSFDGPPTGFAWYVERIYADGGAGTVTIYKGKVQGSNIKDFSPSANKSSLDQASPIFVPPGTEFNIVFAGGTANYAAQCNLQVREVEL